MIERREERNALSAELDALLLSIISKLPDGDLKAKHWRQHQLKTFFLSLNTALLGEDGYEDLDKHAHQAAAEILLALGAESPDLQTSFGLIRRIKAFGNSQQSPAR